MAGSFWSALAGPNLTAGERQNVVDDTLAGEPGAKCAWTEQGMTSDLGLAPGYKGERAVVMVATDLPALQALGEVGANMLKQAGINVDVQSTDWGAVIQRRASKAPVDKGGWSVFFTSFFGVDQFTPATHLGLRGNGEAGWFGWCSSPKLEQLRDAWFQAPDMAAQKAIAVQIQEQAFQDVPYLPTGGVLSADCLPQDGERRAERLAADAEREEGSVTSVGPVPLGPGSAGRKAAVKSAGLATSVVRHLWP